MIIYYIRHGDPIYKPDSLTPLGRRQAEAISKRLAVYGLDEIYCSPSTRAMQTAQPACEVLKKEPIVLDWCLERLAFNDMSVKVGEDRFWCYQHKPTVELFALPEVRALGSEWYTHPAFKDTRFGEGGERVQNEVDDFLLGLGYRHDREKSGYIAESPNDKRIAIFAHEGFGFLFMSALTDIPYNDFCTRFAIGFTGMTVIEFSEEKGFCIPRVLQHSNDSHLYREGLGTKYYNRIPI